ncbi:hypothetical protein B9W61_06720 [Streptomyces sp. CS057]|nr:hypothetical protein B9W61_06720 [Streptomyces sp. CS057]
MPVDSVDPVPAQLSTDDRPAEIPRYSGDWLNESSGNTAALTSTPETGRPPCDCTLDWITLRHAGNCPPSP